MKKIIIIVLAAILTIAGLKFYLDSVKSKQEENDGQEIETAQNSEETSTDSTTLNESEVQSLEMDNDFEPSEVEEEYTVEVEEGLEGVLSD